MQANKNSKNGFTGLKILIGAISLTGTFGFWGFIANKPVEAANPTEDPGKNQLLNTNSLVLNLSPLPTLVPIQNAGNFQNVSQNTQNFQSQTLRQVSQPTPAPFTVGNKPVFEQINISRSGNGGGGSTSSGSSR